MFTGIVQGQAVIQSTKDSAEELFRSLTIKFPVGALENLTKGASISLNGTCLTVTAFDVQQSVACFDVIEETLVKTNLGELSTDQRLNFERAARYGDEIGGHIMSGHIFETVELIDINKTASNTVLTFSLSNTAQPYVLSKGFVGLNGCSLTVGAVRKNQFDVHLIPETLQVTTFGELEIGARVNIELDPSTQAIVDTVKRVMADS